MRLGLMLIISCWQNFCNFLLVNSTATILRFDCQRILILLFLFLLFMLKIVHTSTHSSTYSSSDYFASFYAQFALGACILTHRQPPSVIRVNNLLNFG